MPRLKVRFDEPRHGWIQLLLYDGSELILHRAVSRIYNSFYQLVAALSNLADGGKEDRLVTWMEEPRETEVRFTRRGTIIRLSVTTFPNRTRPMEMPEPDFSFEGTYDEVCLPFWRGLRELEGRYTTAELAEGWQGNFPHHELALLTEQLGKN